jgi:hypothetical protein
MTHTYTLFKPTYTTGENDESAYAYNPPSSKTQTQTRTGSGGVGGRAAGAVGAVWAVGTVGAVGAAGTVGTGGAGESLDCNMYTYTIIDTLLMHTHTYTHTTPIIMTQGPLVKSG